ncbi:ABC-2 type transport system ATP-binding protein [Nocardioides zeae]|uniref:ABC-2 type transport system ATP-binding protein n=1 Tax=Nocardioides zeae TaxID=1457234 RepID=A0ACC6IDV1_9ACTN|nr:ABC transporter ATP-binding protein [Nocardioides zeae]MDR6174131.1 ABC-2 type transport system ATP-binding protein [Nocardioides zeae]MDR6208938.1 ABC-2 type transport system ATP-binding protein [Nocardioides zeae]
MTTTHPDGPRATRPHDGPAVALRALTKTFRTRAGDVTAVRGIDLTIQPGEVVAVLGPNGAGKTTTLDMLLGLTEPTSGSVEVVGLAPRRAIATARVSAVLQTGGLLHDLTVGETVRLVASTYRHPAPVDDVLERAGLTGLASRLVSKCSGGEQQRLRFALALLPEPDLLVLDEPTAGMDVTARRDFWAAMHAEAAGGRTVVFATHYLEEADQFADRIVVVADGRVIADGTTAEIRSRASGRTVRATLPATLSFDARHATLVGLRRHPGAASVTVDESGRVTVVATDSDAVARALLVDVGAHDLEVVAGSLDDAFVALTSAPAGATAPQEESR